MKGEQEVRERLEELEEQRLEEIEETKGNPGMYRDKEKEYKIEVLQWVLEDDE